MKWSARGVDPAIVSGGKLRATEHGLRILFVINDMGLGGAEIQVASLAKHLAARGHVVHVCVLMRFLEYEAELNSAGVGTTALEMTKARPDPRALLQFAALLRDYRPDVVHGHLFASIVLTRVARIIVPYPVQVSTTHSSHEWPLRYKALGLTDPLCDLWTNVCQPGLECYLKAGAVAASKAAHTPNGIDVERFARPCESARASLRSRLQIPSGFVWLAVGSFRDEAKDYSNLLRAFKHLRASAPERDTWLWIAGDGALRGAKEALAHQLGVADRIRFLGLRTDVNELMWAADAFVLGSAWEAHSIVLLEAAAASLPSVATDVGGNAQVVKSGQTGFTVPPHDHTALAKAMLRMLESSSATLAEMGRTARNLAERDYSLEVVVKGWEARYRELLGKRPRRRIAAPRPRQARSS